MNLSSVSTDELSFDDTQNSTNSCILIQITSWHTALQVIVTATQKNVTIVLCGLFNEIINLFWVANQFFSSGNVSPVGTGKRTIDGLNKALVHQYNLDSAEQKIKVKTNGYLLQVQHKGESMSQVQS